jgi:hypothetical protein
MQRGLHIGGGQVWVVGEGTEIAGDGCDALLTGTARATHTQLELR